MKKIAIIGTGISGLVCANILHNKYEIIVFESSDYIGGHTHTVDITMGNVKIPIDTGFIVFNKKTYPHFTKLLNQLGVAIQETEMSFSYRSDNDNIEYNGHNLNTLFSDRKNIVNKKFYRFIIDILRFNCNAKNFIRINHNQSATIRDFLQSKNYSQQFVTWYLIPLIASIWSKSEKNVMKCPAAFIFKFLNQHGLLDLTGRPSWCVLENGSRSYIPPLIKNFHDKIYLNQKVTAISRRNGQVLVKTTDSEMTFDGVVIATHSNDALQILSDPNEEETSILSAMPYAQNSVILHTDAQYMPKNRRAWASWNYIQIPYAEGSQGQDAEKPLTLTYYMNRLQNLKIPQDFFVSVNMENHIRPDKIIEKFSYSHPIMKMESVTAWQKQALINGRNNTYYAGSYWGYGFHEDGVRSAFNASQSLQETIL